MSMKVDERILDTDTLEGIHYQVSIIPVMRASADQLLICETLLKLPRRIREKILHDIVFVAMSDGLTGTADELVLRKEEPAPIILDRVREAGEKGWEIVHSEIKTSMVFLNFALMKKMSKNRIMSIIAHEIAHSILRHGYASPRGRRRASPKEWANEREADDLCKKWGFARAYKMSVGTYQRDHGWI